MEDIAVQPQSDQQHAGASAKCLQNKHGNTAHKKKSTLNSQLF